MNTGSRHLILKRTGTSADHFQNGGRSCQVVALLYRNAVKKFDKIQCFVLFTTSLQRRKTFYL